MGIELGTAPSALGTTVTEGELAFTDVTTANASTTKHGLLPKLDNVATNFLNGQGGYTAPAGGANTALSNLASVSLNAILNYVAANAAAAILAGETAGGVNNKFHVGLTGAGPALGTDNTQNEATRYLIFDLSAFDANNRTIAFKDVSGTAAVVTAVGSTVGAVGGASALPALPLGYATIALPDGTTAKIPYYNT